MPTSKCYQGTIYFVNIFFFFFLRGNWYFIHKEKEYNRGHQLIEII